MNDKQRDSAAKYAYDVSKGLVVAAFFSVVTGAGGEQFAQLLGTAACFFFVGWRLER